MSDEIKLKKDGTPDMRYSENRTRGYNMDGSLDMRFKENRSSSPSSSFSCHHHYYQPTYDSDSDSDDGFSIPSSITSRYPPPSSFSSSDAMHSYLMNLFYSSQQREREEREERERRERREREERELQRQREEVARKKREQEERERQERERKERERREQEQKKQAAESSFASKRASAKTAAIKDESAALSNLVEKAYNEQKEKLSADALKESVAKFLAATDSQKSVGSAITAKVAEVAPQAAEGMKHFNAVVVGKTGVGKSTLLNAVLGLQGKDEEAETGVGRPVTQGKPREYSAEGLRLWDTKGIEVGAYGPAAVTEDVKELVDRTALAGDSDAYIHAIWYCVLTQGARLEDVERDTLVELMRVYDGGKLPVIVVLTQAYSKQDAATMEAEVRKIVDAAAVAAKEKGEEKRSALSVVSVVAKEKVMDEFTIKSRGLDNLLRETSACAVLAARPACQHSVKVQVEKALVSEYGSAAFRTKLEGEGAKGASTAEAEAGKKSGLRPKMALLADALSSAAACGLAFFGGKKKKSRAECAKALSDSGVVSVVVEWAVGAFGKVSAGLADAGEKLGAKYAEAQHQVERSSGCQISGGKSLSDWTATAKKEVADALQEKAECAAFKKAAGCVVPVFAEALSKAVVEMMKKEIASDDVTAQIERVIGEAVTKAAEDILVKNNVCNIKR